jgi:hypothetical protein
MARHHLTLAAFSLLLLSPLALADKIWLKGDATPTPAEGQAPDFLYGVVTSEEGGEYTVRIPGGTVMLAKSQVARVEKDGLTLPQLEEGEKEMRKQVADADSKRSRDLAQWADAALRERTAARADEERAQALDVTVDFKGLIPSPSFRFYLPLLTQIDLDGLGRAIENFLRGEVVRLSPRYDPVRHVLVGPPSEADLRQEPHAEPVQDAALNPVQKGK